jgi:hypothetical protein
VDPLRRVALFAGHSLVPSSFGRPIAFVRQYPGGDENAKILRPLSRDMLNCRASSRRLIPSLRASLTCRKSSTV